MAERFVPPSPDQWQGSASDSGGFTPPPVESWEGGPKHRYTPEEVKAHFANFAPAKDWRDQPWTELAGGFNDTVKGFAAAMAPKSAAEFALGPVIPVVRGAAAMLGSHVDQAKQAMDSKRPAVERAGHALAAVTPGGPFAAQIGETLPDNPPRAAGMAATALIPKAASKAPPVARVVADKTGDMISAASDVATSPGTGTMLRGAVEAGGGIAATVSGHPGYGLPAVLGGGIDIARGWAKRQAAKSPGVVERDIFKPSAITKRNMGPSVPADNPYSAPAGVIIPRKGLTPVEEPSPVPSVEDVKFSPSATTKRNMPRYGGPSDESSSISSRNRPRQGVNRAMDPEPEPEALVTAKPPGLKWNPKPKTEGKPKSPKSEPAATVETKPARAPASEQAYPAPEGAEPNYSAPKEHYMKQARTVRGKALSRLFRDEPENYQGWQEWKPGDAQWKKAAEGAGVTVPNSPESIKAIVDEFGKLPPKKANGIPRASVNRQDLIDAAMASERDPDFAIRRAEELGYRVA